LPFISFAGLGKDLIESNGTVRQASLFDTKLSSPEGQSCAVCHDPEVGFTGPDAEINKAGAVYEGAAKGRFGNRKPPTSSYGGDSPVLHFDKREKVWVGGMFWDGRATGKQLKDALAEQAQGPFLNPLEQNIPDSRTICIMVKNASYASLFEQVWGKGSLDCSNNVSSTYDRIARSIAPTRDRRKQTLSAQSTITGSGRR